MIPANDGQRRQIQPHHRLGGGSAATANPPEFDWQGAVARLGGQATTYAALSRRFLDGVDASLARLYPLLCEPSAAASEEAAQLLHSLRGSALTLGAMELAEMTHVAEAALTAPEPLERTALLARLSDAIERALTTLRKIVEQLEADANP